MAKRGRPPKPPSERTTAVSIKFKYLQVAYDSRLNINQYIESLQKTIIRREESIRYLEEEIQKLNKEREKQT